jgi:dihydroflavonol-4-reductase
VKPPWSNGSVSTAMITLVTGASGFIGSHLCRALLEAGHTVRAFHRPSSNLRLLEGLDLQHAPGDLTQPESLLEAMQGCEAVFHCAAWMGSSDQSGKLYAVTVEGTRALLNAAHRCGVQRVVHTSSVAALGVPANHLPVDEHHTWNFRPEVYPYGYAKYLAELEVQKAVARGLDVVIVNPSLVFGPGDIYRQSSSLVTQVAKRKLSVAVEGGINVVHVQDVVAGHLAALERGHRGERYILGGENLTYLQLINAIAEITAAPAPSLVLPGWLVRAAARPLGRMQAFLDLPVQPHLLRMAGVCFFYDIRKAAQELGWQPLCSARQAIQDAYEWFN